MTKKQIEKLLQPFYGYVELGMFQDAEDEWENLPEKAKTHPIALLDRLRLFMDTMRWEEGLKFAEKLCASHPSDASFWINRACCCHSLGRSAEAKAVLLSGPEFLKAHAVYYYNLACYEAQLGDINSAKRLLALCFQKDKSFKQRSLCDPDLEPVWNSIETEV